MAAVLRHLKALALEHQVVVVVVGDELRQVDDAHALVEAGVEGGHSRVISYRRGRGHDFSRDPGPIFERSAIFVISEIA